jgi:hypothetical protein
LSPSLPGVFVSSANSLRPVSGGQQLCTREYLRTLEAAGFRLTLVDYQSDRRFWVRVRRRLWPQPYSGLIPSTLLPKVLEAARHSNARFVFLNVVDVAPLASPLRHHLPEGCRIVLLSHGLESADYLHTLRADGGGIPFAQTSSGSLLRLGRQLMAECRQRQDIDHVFCLAPFEVELERWLGARSVDWLPRTIPQAALAWQPDFSRIGFVGTLDHPPNREGLELFLKALEPLAPARLAVRVVGGPAQAGAAMQRRFPRINYLGTLSDAELESEAATWACFVHPIFCYARGCSTKLAVALGWRIPVATTTAGCRGYTWSKGSLPLAETPADLAALTMKLLDETAARAAAREVAAIADSSPTLEEVAQKMRRCLCPAS